MDREIYQQDAFDWLADRGVLHGCSLVTSLPDWSEFPALSLVEWKAWFENAARTVLRACPADGVVIFYQRDAKHDGAWIDKGFLCQKAAEAHGARQLWHKIVARAPAGAVTFGRPGYSHLLCFSVAARAEVARSTPDLLPEAGASTWTRGMGVHACLTACRFVLDHTPTRTVVDPFCGHGTVLAVANGLGLKGIGVEKGRKRAERARRLNLEKLGGSALAFSGNKHIL